jgi:hypothetical protein
VRVRQELDSVHVRVVLLAALGVAAASALAVAIAAGVLASEAGRIASFGPATRARPQPTQVNALDTELFTYGPRAASSAPAERLRRYGFVDRERQRVHIPIDRAIELYLERREEADAVDLGRAPAP